LQNASLFFFFLDFYKVLVFNNPPLPLIYQVSWSWPVNCKVMGRRLHLIGTRQKLVLGFSGLLVIVAAMGVMTIRQIDALDGAVDVILKQNYRRVEDTGEGIAQFYLVPGQQLYQ
jgi:hypothetical protein